MSHHLTACFEKVKRAHEQLDALNEAISGVIEVDPYMVRIEPYRQHVWQRVLPRTELEGVDLTREGIHEIAEGLFQVNIEVLDEFGLILRRQPSLAPALLRL